MVNAFLEQVDLIGVLAPIDRNHLRARAAA